MKRLALLLAAVATPLCAQSTEDRLAKARLEVNNTENTADRAVYACSRNQQPKCTDEARAAANAASRALYAVDAAIAAVHAEHATPVPVPVPTPAPTPTPAPALSGLLSEGDSLSIVWNGSHTGLYAKANPTVTFNGKAVGGSGIAQLNDRFAADAALRPALVTVFIGANDLSRWDSTTADPWLADLWAYTARWKATGAKVLVATVLGKCEPNLAANNTKHNSLRSVANPAIRAAVGTKIDAVIDFAADPVMGTDAAACDKALFQDGVHATEGYEMGQGGQGKLAVIYQTAVRAALSGSPAPAAGYVPSPSLAGGPDLVASFPVNEGLGPSWGSGAIPGPYSANEGAFRLTCGGELPTSYDDPLVKYAQPGTSHAHYPFGAFPFNAYMTSSNLAQIATSTCNYGNRVLNRSAYWIPALQDDQGNDRKADWIALYYKRAKASSPSCTPGSPTQQGTCIGLPNQIRFLSGWDQFRPAEQGKGNSWYCTGGSGGHFLDLDAVFQSGCKAGDTLVADLAFPNCWDGKWLDTPNHREHMAFGSYGSWGYLKCPETHPYVIPQAETKYAWTVTADMYQTVGGVVRSRLHLSSDHMKPGAKPGETFHGDYMEQWVAAAKKMWEDNCINLGLDCSGGDLGNGLQLRGASQPSYGWVNPNPRVPTPPTP